jgi:Family of unknown function (DUF6263)
MFAFHTLILFFLQLFPGTPPRKITFHPRPGSAFEYDLSDTIRSEIKIGTSPANVTSSIIHFTFHLKWADSTTSDGYTATLMFTAVNVGYGEPVGPASDTSLSLGKRMHAAFIGPVFMLRFDNSGNATILQGYNEFKHRFDSLYTSLKADDPTNIYSKEPLTLLFGRISASLPDTGVMIGASWTKQISTVNSTGNTNIKKQYHLNTIQGDVAEIQTSSKNIRTYTSENVPRQDSIFSRGFIKLDAGSGLVLLSKDSSTIARTTMNGPFANTLLTTRHSAVIGKPIQN